MVVLCQMIRLPRQRIFYNWAVRVMDMLYRAIVYRDCDIYAILGVVEVLRGK